MRKTVAILAAAVSLALAAAAGAGQAVDFSSIFGSRFAEAESYLKSNGWIAAALHLPPEDVSLALAVVFPEVLRFSALEDIIQVRALKVLYVQYGAKYADFSVGRFQMKPTFAVQLERDANRFLSPEERAAAEVPEFPAADTSANRRDRVLRLDDLRWQVRYLGLFVRLMVKRHRAVVFADVIDRVRYCATAYNAGYTKGESSLRRLMPLKSYHIELFDSTVKYCYADIAAFYYSRLKK